MLHETKLWRVSDGHLSTYHGESISTPRSSQSVRQYGMVVLLSKLKHPLILHLHLQLPPQHEQDLEATHAFRVSAKAQRANHQD